VKEFALQKGGIADVKIRHDNRIFATAGWDHRVRIFDFQKYHPLAILKYHTGTVHSLAFGVNEFKSLLATGSDDTNIALWSLY